MPTCFEHTTQYKNFKTHIKEYILLSVTKRTLGCLEHIKWPHDGRVTFHTARQQSTSLNETEEAYCAESDMRSSKEWKSRLPNKLIPNSKFRNNYIKVWNHERSKFRRTNVTNFEITLCPFACYSMINFYFAFRSTYQSYKWLREKIVEFYVKFRTKILGPHTFGTQWPLETMNLRLLAL